ncbi:MAG: hypothetical protein AAGG01_17200, partial [Planctomycetota bacterium]
MSTLRIALAATLAATTACQSVNDGAASPMAAGSPDNPSLARLEQGEGWDIDVRVGAIAMPTYIGDDKSQVWVAPDVSAKRGNFFFSFYEGA